MTQPSVFAHTKSPESDALQRQWPFSHTLADSPTKGYVQLTAHESPDSTGWLQLLVAFAAGVSVPAEDRAEFTRLLEQALAIDPDEDTSMRLLNLVNQKRAQMLLDHVDDLFFDPAGTQETLP